MSQSKSQKTDASIVLTCEVANQHCTLQTTRRVHICGTQEL